MSKLDRHSCSFPFTQRLNDSMLFLHLEVMITILLTILCVFLVREINCFIDLIFRRPPRQQHEEDQINHDDSKENQPRKRTTALVSLESLSQSWTRFLDYLLVHFFLFIRSKITTHHIHSHSWTRLTKARSIMKVIQFS